ncbi:MAG: sensor histidine kinase [Vulcanimicrobiota bacterium]
MARRPKGRILQSIAANINDAAIGIDRDGKIVIFNEAAEKLFQKDSDDIIGKKIWDEMEINNFTRSFIAIVKESDPTPLEQLIPFPDNRVFNIKMIPVRGNDNRIVGAIAILKDLTEIQKMELTVNEFVEMVSHELKTPLTSIKGFVETLLEGALDNPEVTRRFLQVINEETNRLTRLVIGLSDLTRATRQNSEDHAMSPVNTSKFITGVVRLFEQLAHEKQVELNINIQEELPTIYVDEDKIRQVIINLIDNALKYTAIKGPGNFVEVNARATDNFVQVQVKDTGVGIPTDEKDRIFEKFYRVNKGKAAQLGGTGLGLSITREIIETHGGRITVESQENKGSVFSFNIPIHEEGEAQN